VTGQTANIPIEHLLRELAPQVLGAVMRRFHDFAAAMVHGPRKGLELLNGLDADARLAGHHRLDAVRAHLLEMAGDREAAITHYRLAAGRTTSLPERNYLMTQAARLSESAQSADRAAPRTNQ
jgi:predicted RNA polymerase sigma factor